MAEEKSTWIIKLRIESFMYYNQIKIIRSKKKKKTQIRIKIRADQERGQNRANGLLHPSSRKFMASATKVGLILSYLTKCPINGHIGSTGSCPR